MERSRPSTGGYISNSRTRTSDQSSTTTTLDDDDIPLASDSIRERVMNRHGVVIPAAIVASPDSDEDDDDIPLASDSIRERVMNRHGVVIPAAIVASPDSDEDDDDIPLASDSIRKRVMNRHGVVIPAAIVASPDSDEDDDDVPLPSDSIRKRVINRHFRQGVVIPAAKVASPDSDEVDTDLEPEATDLMVHRISDRHGAKVTALPSDEQTVNILHGSFNVKDLDNAKYISLRPTITNPRKTRSRLSRTRSQHQSLQVSSLDTSGDDEIASFDVPPTPLPPKPTNSRSASEVYGELLSQGLSKSSQGHSQTKKNVQPSNQQEADLDSEEEQLRKKTKSVAKPPSSPDSSVSEEEEQTRSAVKKIVSSNSKTTITNPRKTRSRLSRTPSQHQSLQVSSPDTNGDDEIASFNVPPTPLPPKPTNSRSASEVHGVLHSQRLSKSSQRHSQTKKNVQPSNQQEADSDSEEELLRKKTKFVAKPPSSPDSSVSEEEEQTRSVVKKIVNSKSKTPITNPRKTRSRLSRTRSQHQSLPVSCPDTSGDDEIASFDVPPTPRPPNQTNSRSASEVNGELLSQGLSKSSQGHSQTKKNVQPSNQQEADSDSEEELLRKKTKFVAKPPSSPDSSVSEEEEQTRSAVKKIVSSKSKTTITNPRKTRSRLSQTRSQHQSLEVSSPDTNGDDEIAFFDVPSTPLPPNQTNSRSASEVYGELHSQGLSKSSQRHSQTKKNVQPSNQQEADSDSEEEQLRKKTKFVAKPPSSPDSSVSEEEEQTRSAVKKIVSSKSKAAITNPRETRSRLSRTRSQHQSLQVSCPDTSGDDEIASFDVPPTPLPPKPTNSRSASEVNGELLSQGLIKSSQRHSQTKKNVQPSNQQEADSDSEEEHLRKKTKFVAKPPSSSDSSSVSEEEEQTRSAVKKIVSSKSKKTTTSPRKMRSRLSRTPSQHQSLQVSCPDTNGDDEIASFDVPPTPRPPNQTNSRSASEGNGELLSQELSKSSQGHSQTKKNVQPSNIQESDSDSEEERPRKKTKLVAKPPSSSDSSVSEEEEQPRSVVKKIVSSKPKKKSLDELYSNANMISKAKIQSFLEVVGKSVNPKQLAKIHGASNVFIEKFLDQLCERARNSHGVFSYRELESALQTQGLISTKKNALALEFCTTLTLEKLRKISGILVPSPGEHDTHFNDELQG